MSTDSPPPKRGLGKGLNALIKAPSTPVNVAKPTAPAVISEPVSGEQVMKVQIDQIVPSPFQPRKRFNEDLLQELADSIKEHGIIQPLVVRQVEGRFELIAGERRLRASQKAGLTEVPVVTRESTDEQVLAMALIENIQREDLDPMEEAAAYMRLSVDLGLKQDEIAQRVGKKRATIANMMRLLDLDNDVKTMVSQKNITAGHAKALLAVKSGPEQRMLADVVIRKGLSVRDTEALVQEHTTGKSGGAKKKSTDGGLPEQEDTYLKFVEDKLRSHFSTNVVLNHKEKKGKIEIEYYGNEDLSRVMEQMGINLD